MLNYIKGGSCGFDERLRSPNVSVLVIFVIFVYLVYFVTALC